MIGWLKGLFCWHIRGELVMETRVRVLNLDPKSDSWLEAAYYHECPKCGNVLLWSKTTTGWVRVVPGSSILD